MQGMGPRLRARARELGLSDSEVARRLELSQPRYANYVNDINEPDLATLIRICRTLDTTPAVVLGWESAPTQAPNEVLKARIVASVNSMSDRNLIVAAALMDTLASLPQ